jgi:hypothetical protein
MAAKTILFETNVNDAPAIFCDLKAGASQSPGVIWKTSPDTTGTVCDVCIMTAQLMHWGRRWKHGLCDDPTFCSIRALLLACFCVTYRRLTPDGTPNSTTPVDFKFG